MEAMMQEANAAGQTVTEARSVQDMAAEGTDARAVAEASEALRKENEALKAALLESRASLAALSMGVKPERLPFVMKLAALEGIDVTEQGAEDAINAALSEILQQLPEWTGGAYATPAGSVGDHKYMGRGSATSDDSTQTRSMFLRGMR